MSRVICLVPSLTETLIAGGVPPVGRTRYCIHPQTAVSSIPIVAGTKDWDWQKICALSPDLILLDRDENARFMADQTDIPCYTTHIGSIKDVSAAMDDLADLLHARALKDMAERWRTIAKHSCKPWQVGEPLPGLIEWGRAPHNPIKRILYLVWQKPWIAASRRSFIGSVLAQLGVEIMTFGEKYPQIDLSSFDPGTTLLLFSSEPYPFLQRKGHLASLDFPHAFVDGEQIGWYGIRSLLFLEAQLARTPGT